MSETAQDALIEYGRSVHKRTHQIKHNRDEVEYLLLSDLHWDNPHCSRELLKRDLDEAVKRDARIIINGDFFCFMQGKYDPRRRKSNIRPEHNVNNYIDAVIEDAVNWFEPYVHNIDVIGYGNHETAILKNLETDPLQRFVDLANYTYKSNIMTGGYSGWFVVQMKQATVTKLYKIFYHHGFGGGGPVTKGVIQNNRVATQIQGADLIWMGHVHEDYELSYMEQYLSQDYKVQHKEILHVRTASYKEEYEDGYMDFHVERGRPPKPLGGRWLKISFERFKKHSRQILEVHGRTIKT